MTEATAQHLPYAPPSAVVGVIRRYRNRGLADPVTTATLQQVGVSAGNAARTLQALKFLGLVDDEGHTTNTFKRLGQANPTEYPPTLAEILRGVYHPIFNHVDPSQDDIEDIEHAFWGFEPKGQRNRMMTLFLGLGFEAGIVPEDKAPKVQSQPRRQRQSERSTNQRTQRRKETPKTPVSPPPEETPHREKDAEHNYPLVQAVVEQLPKNGRWTQKRRDLWMQAITSAVDLAVEIEEVYEGEIMPDQQEIEGTR